ncbi:hypothetical protein FRC18_005295 [Serendipita sp. 400]|nr:hypothetical protein FRC18_005295 [Serendipita sp. 400]
MWNLFQQQPSSTCSNLARLIRHGHRRLRPFSETVPPSTPLSRIWPSYNNKDDNILGISRTNNITTETSSRHLLSTSNGNNNSNRITARPISSSDSIKTSDPLSLTNLSTSDLSTHRPLSTTPQTTEKRSGVKLLNLLSSSLPSNPPKKTLFGRIPRFNVFVDRLGLSLSFPVSAICAVLTLSAALRFRHDFHNLHNSNSHLSTQSPALSSIPISIKPRSEMIVQEKTSNGVDSPAATAANDMKTMMMTESPSLAEVELPNYEQATTGSSSAAAGPSTSGGINSPPAPSNLVHVFRRDGSIQGKWNIDPDLVVPTALLGDDPDKERPLASTSWWDNQKKKKGEVKEEEKQKREIPNLTLHTRDGRIHADVWITNSIATPVTEKQSKHTTLDLYTRDGDIILRLCSKGRRPVKINAYTHDGRIRIFLPRSFVGLVLHTIYDGKIIFSPAMQPSVSTFSMIEGKRGSTFIGDWKQAMGAEGKEVTVDSWDGDQCEVTTRDGSILFFWEDEYEEVMSKSRLSWFTSLFSS